MMSVYAPGIVFYLARFDLFQEISDVFVVSQGYLDAHAIQTLHCGLAHASADKHLAVPNVIEFGHVCGIAAHAVVMIVIVIVIVVVMIVRIRQFSQFLFCDFALIEREDEEGAGLPEMSRNGLAVVSGDCDFSCHNVW